MLSFNVLGKFFVENEELFTLGKHAHRFMCVQGESWDTESVSSYDYYTFLDSDLNPCGHPKTRNAGTGGGQWEEIQEFALTGEAKYLLYEWRHENGFKVDVGEGIYVLTSLRPDTLEALKAQERERQEQEGRKFREAQEREMQELRLRRAKRKKLVA